MQDKTLQSGAARARGALSTTTASPADTRANGTSGLTNGMAGKRHQHRPRRPLIGLVGADAAHRAVLSEAVAAEGFEASIGSYASIAALLQHTADGDPSDFRLVVLHAGSDRMSAVDELVEMKRSRLRRLPVLVTGPETDAEDICAFYGAGAAGVVMHLQLDDFALRRFMTVVKFWLGYGAGPATLPERPPGADDDIK